MQIGTLRIIPANHRQISQSDRATGRSMPVNRTGGMISAVAAEGSERLHARSPLPPLPPALGVDQAGYASCSAATSACLARLDGRTVVRRTSRGQSTMRPMIRRQRFVLFVRMIRHRSLTLRENPKRQKAMTVKQDKQGGTLLHIVVPPRRIHMDWGRLPRLHEVERFQKTAPRNARLRFT